MQMIPYKEQGIPVSHHFDFENKNHVILTL